jgi:hypothetical protein
VRALHQSEDAPRISYQIYAREITPHEPPPTANGSQTGNR